MPTFYQIIKKLENEMDASFRGQPGPYKKNPHPLIQFHLSLYFNTLVMLYRCVTDFAFHASFTKETTTDNFKFTFLERDWHFSSEYFLVS